MLVIGGLLKCLIPLSAVHAGQKTKKKVSFVHNAGSWSPVSSVVNAVNR